MTVSAALDICITTGGSCNSGASPLITMLLPALVGALVAFAGAYF